MGFSQLRMGKRECRRPETWDVLLSDDFKILPIRAFQFQQSHLCYNALELVHHNLAAMLEPIFICCETWYRSGFCVSGMTLLANGGMTVCSELKYAMP